MPTIGNGSSNFSQLRALFESGAGSTPPLTPASPSVAKAADKGFQSTAETAEASKHADSPKVFFQIRNPKNLTNAVMKDPGDRPDRKAKMEAGPPSITPPPEEILPKKAGLPSKISYETLPPDSGYQSLGFAAMMEGTKGYVPIPGQLPTTSNYTPLPERKDGYQPLGFNRSEGYVSVPGKLPEDSIKSVVDTSVRINSFWASVVPLPPKNPGQ